MWEEKLFRSCFLGKVTKPFNLNGNSVYVLQTIDSNVSVITLFLINSE